LAERELRAAQFTTVNEQRNNLPLGQDRPKSAFLDRNYGKEWLTEIIKSLWVYFPKRRDSAIRLTKIDQTMAAVK
jgi:hypothetical protein